MPTTSTSRNTGRNMTRLPGSVSDIMKAGEKPVTQPKPKKLDPKPFVEALKQSLGFHKKSTCFEMAVCLVFLSALGSTDKKARAQLRPLYVKAGFDAAQKGGEHYVSVQKRTDVAAKLLNWMGANEVTIADWTEDAKPEEAIALVAARLEKDKLDSLKAIRMHVEKEKVEAEQKRAKEREAARIAATAKAQEEAAKLAARGPGAAGGAPAIKEGDKATTTTPASQETPQSQDQEPAGPMTAAEQTMLQEAAAGSEARQEAGEPAPDAPRNRRAEDRVPAERVLVTEHLKLVIPPEVTAIELMEMTSKLTMFAAHLQTAATAVQ